MNFYVVLLIVAIIIIIFAYFYFDWGTSKETVTEESLQKKLSKMKYARFKKDYPNVDRKVFIEIKNMLKHHPEQVTDEYLEDLLE